MDQEKLSQWGTIFRDTVIVLLGAFAIIFGVTKITDPTRLGLVLGLGATLLGVPATIRMDAARRRTNGNGDSSEAARLRAEREEELENLWGPFKK